MDNTQKSASVLNKNFILLIFGHSTSKMGNIIYNSLLALWLVLLELSHALFVILVIAVKNPWLSHSFFSILSRYVKNNNEKVHVKCLQER